MKATSVLAALVCAGAAGLAWSWGTRPDAPTTARALDASSEDAAGSPVAAEAPGAARPVPVSGRDEAPTATPAGAFSRRPAPAGVRAAEGGWVHVGSEWPVARNTGRSARNAVTGPEPAVPVRLAFRALWYLGVDPEAEKTWARAIQDPNMPPGVRSDLIVDMIDEGYTDNSHPTQADLPVILARLEILERHAPYAVDAVNAAAFELAYRQLLDLYVRLGGAPRGARKPGVR